MKLSKQKEEEFKDKINNYKYLRETQVSYFQGLYIALIVSIILLLMDFIPRDDYKIKLIIIFLLALLTFFSYYKSIVQTQKPVLACQNITGTVENMSKVKTKDGMEWAIFSLSDIIEKKENEKKESKA